MEFKRVIVITGASSGIGQAIAKAFVNSGDKVYNFSRSAAVYDGVTNIKCDVRNLQSVTDAFKEIERLEGKINLLVLNAGFGISGAVETTEVSHALDQFDTNFFGAFRCVQAAAPLLRKAGKNEARVIFISSLAAVIPIPFQAFYSASKAAICNLSRCLSSEFKHMGISVTAVLPGDIKTEFTDKRAKNDETDKYRESATAAVRVMEKDERNGMKPEKIASLVKRLSHKKRVRPYYTAGLGYKALLLLVRLLPPSLVDFIVRRKYKIKSE